jgi:N utilization substance protein A
MKKKTKKQNKGKKVKAKASARTSRPAKKKTVAKRKAAPKKRPLRVREVAVGSQSVETVPVKGKALRARAGAGGGDFGGVSIVEGADSESAEELLEEGQAFEAGIVSGVEDAPDADQGEVTTHEVPQDDVPEEYEDKDR